MKTASPILESLEPRIAPAGVVFTNGANLLSAGDQGYLSEADSDGDATMLVKVTGGKAKVFWDAETSQIKGISVSNGANIEIWGNVDGDIVTNLQNSGFLSDSNSDMSDGLDGGKLLGSSIAGIKTNAYFDSHGNAQNGDIGRIIAGGSISNVNLNGRLNGIYAGDGIFDAIETATSSDLAEGNAATSFTYVLGENYDTSGHANISTMTLTMGNASLVSGASINGLSFSSGINIQIFAGDGTDGATGSNGGSISKVDFVGGIVDTTINAGFFEGKSYSVSSGDGGNGTLGNGGSGGSINGITEIGSGGDVFIHAGLGGKGDMIKGKGGTGGSISNLDLHGGIINYDITAGQGGNGASGGAGGGVSYTNISAQGPISLSGPFLGTISEGSTHNDFFIINKSTSQMALIDGTNLVSSTLIAPKATGAVDAITVDLNGDDYLDVVVIYSDESLGILINKGAAATLDDAFVYGDVKDIGFEPFKVLAGDFLGDGGNPELAIISTNKIQTTVTLYSATDPTSAANFDSNPNLFKSLVLKKGNLVDAAGGGSPGGQQMQFNPYETTLHSDLVLAFADGTLQGVFSNGEGTTDKPFVFTTKDAPKTTVAGGLRDIDFNFAEWSETESSQALAVVNKGGTTAYVVTIAPLPPPEPVEGEPTPAPSKIFAFTVQSPLPVPSGSGTLLQASWTESSLTSSDTDISTLLLLSSNFSTSKFLLYNNYSGGSMQFMSSVNSDYLLNSTSNNFLFTSTANSYIFTTGNATIAVAREGVLPEQGPVVAITPFPLLFEGMNLQITSGDGGTGTTGSGGNGGDLKSLNFDASTAEITAGHGGISTSGAGGNGGSINNSASFRTATATIIPSMSAAEELSVEAGNGASVSGSGMSSKGGNGGSITGVTFTTTGFYTVIIEPSGAKIVYVLGSATMTAGNGGNSESLSAGTGGSISSTKVFDARNITLNAGMGGSGTVSAKATGGNGGSINGLVGGDSAEKAEDEKTRFITGSVYAYAGIGGNSDLARAGSGGNISSINVQNMDNSNSDPAVQQEQDLILEAGNGGTSGGLDKAANGGTGGSVSGVTSENTNIKPTMTAGNGGDANGGVGGTGGSLANLKYIGGIINLASGNGGISTSGTGGSGGALTGIKTEIVGSGHMEITSGAGGTSTSGIGGNGGTLSNIFLKLDPADKAALDETLGVTIASGNGGSGARGGNGGLISAVYCEGVYSNAANDGFLTVIDSIAMKFVSGKGGDGSTAEGGNGGSINFTKTLLGLSQIDEHSINANFLPSDEALRVFAGDGGNGATKGGTGGSISGLKSANVKNSLGDSIPTNLLGSALLQSGNGGNGGSGDAGAGGSITGAKLSVERHGTDLTGNLQVLTGTGGLSIAGKGGLGGAILNSSFTAVNGSNDDGYGLLLQTGNGGNGGKGGGAGGNLSTVTVSSTSLGLNGTNSDIYCAVLVAGNGGDGTGAVKSLGGAGGSILGLNQLKDNYSVINLIQAGSGGDSSVDAAGGVGGSVSNVKSSGTIGAQIARAIPSDPGIRQGLFNTIATSTLIDDLIPDNAPIQDHHQGIFAGLGGTGLARGANGSVSNISAPAIAAIGAANLFGDLESAAAVSKIATLLLGYDIDNDGAYDVGDGYVSATKFDINKDLVSLDPEIVSTTSLIAHTTPFVNP